MPTNKRYTIFIEQDDFADPQKHPSGIAWRSGVLDITDGEEVIDQEGDIATYEEAKELALNLLIKQL